MARSVNAGIEKQRSGRRTSILFTHGHQEENEPFGKEEFVEFCRLAPEKLSDMRADNASQLGLANIKP